MLPITAKLGNFSYLVPFVALMFVSLILKEKLFGPLSWFINYNWCNFVSTNSLLKSRQLKELNTDHYKLLKI
jgi:hypothetical protein